MTSFQTILLMLVAASAMFMAYNQMDHRSSIDKALDNHAIIMEKAGVKP